MGEVFGGGEGDSNISSFPLFLLSCLLLLSLASCPSLLLVLLLLSDFGVSCSFWTALMSSLCVSLFSGVFRVVFSVSIIMSLFVIVVFFDLLLCSVCVIPFPLRLLGCLCLVHFRHAV